MFIELYSPTNSLNRPEKIKEKKRPVPQPRTILSGKLYAITVSKQLLITTLRDNLTYDKQKDDRIRVIFNTKRVFRNSI